MKKVYKFLSIFMGLFVVANLVACGENSDEKTVVTISSNQKYMINYDLNGGSSNTELNSKEVESITNDDFVFDLVKDNCKFRGWELDGTLIFDELGNMVNEVTYSSEMNFKAVFDQNAKLTISKFLSNDNQLMPIEYNIGDVSESGFYELDSYVDVHSNQNEEYKFIGWYNDDVLLSNDSTYRFKIDAEEFVLNAVYEYTKYNLSVSSNNAEVGTATIENADTITYDAYFKQNITVKAISKTDTRFLGWYNDNDELVSTELEYSFEMPNSDYYLEAKWNKFNISYNLDGGENASDNPSTYEVGDKIKLEAPTKLGYIFIGWTGSGLTNPTMNVEIVNSINDLYFKANYKIITYNIQYNVDYSIDDFDNPTTYTVEDEFVLNDLTFNKFITIDNNYYMVKFEGWYTDEDYNNKVTEIEHGTTEDLNLYGKISYVAFDFNEYINNGGAIENFFNNGGTNELFFLYGGKYLRVNENLKYSENGSYILLGLYPQTKVSDPTDVSYLKNYVSLIKPSSSNSQGFTSYEYFVNSSNTTSYMWYKDLDIDNNGLLDYRCVYFDQYRPALTTNGSSFKYSYQYDHGYLVSNYYFFKYEPIKWKILKENDGKATLLSELVIDSQAFNNTSNTQTINGKTICSNNYEYSTIRKWLNENFYNTAFSNTQKTIINKVKVDNTASTTASSSNSYVCNDTNDFVWLLSYKEVRDTNYNITIFRESTDYAKCQGCNTPNDNYFGGCNWLTRSPSSQNDSACVTMDYSGARNDFYVNFAAIGVLPAITITL